jgi:methyl-accepting chemotaxis protein
VVTRRVASTTAAMRAGVTRVAEVEHLSRDLDLALAEILNAAALTREAAGGVTAAAYENRVAVTDAAASLSAVARTAEGHAATAQQVSATTQEQSAACGQMSAASAQLLAGSTELRHLVGGLRT